MMIVMVLLAGAAVMIYEFIAVRIMARYFGSSLDVWASVITVLLAGLCVGYALGGILSERYGTLRPMAIMLAFAGISGLFMEQVNTAVGEFMMTTEFALRWQPYVAAAAVSLVPILALGTILPQAIRLRARGTEQVGTAAGWISALSTLGSVLGILVCVHVLLPHMGVRAALTWVSIKLIAWGLVFAVLSSRRLGLVAVAALLIPATAHSQIRYEDYSAYHHILVEDINGERQLRFDEAIQTTMSLYDPNSGGFEYTTFFHVPILLNPTIKSALFIGLGGGTGPKEFLLHYPYMRIEVAEIDPEVHRIAQEYFALPKDPRLRVTIRDGRVHLQRSRKNYGTIIMDAYASGVYGPYLPYHLVTDEFFKLVWERLDNGGCLVFNVASNDLKLLAPETSAIYSTMARTFQAIYIFDAQSSFNSVLVAQKIVPGAVADGETQQAWPEGPWTEHPLTAKQLRQMARTLLDNGYIIVPGFDSLVGQLSPITSSPPSATIYTDNFAPVDITPGGRRPTATTEE